MTDETAEYLGIQRTLAAYNLAGDRLKVADLAAQFTEEGVLETPTGTMTGRAAITAGLGPGGTREGAAAPTRRPNFVRHNLTTSRYELTGPDTAEGKTYFVVYTDIGADHMGFYTDRMRKVDGRWYIEHRRVLLDWMAENSLFESQLAHHKARLKALGRG